MVRSVQAGFARSIIAQEQLRSASAGLAVGSDLFAGDPRQGPLPRAGRLSDVDVTATLAADVPIDALYDVVFDLGTYPDWLDIVTRADQVDLVDGEDAAWSIDLRGQVGPFRRSKRLRMVRTAYDDPDADGHASVRFERREIDGRDHSDWVMTAVLAGGVGADGGGAPELQMALHYGGSLWVPMLDRLLSDEIERSRPRLVAYVERIVGDQR